MAVQEGMVFVEQESVMGQVVVEERLEGPIAISFFMDYHPQPLHYSSGVGVYDE